MTNYQIAGLIVPSALRAANAAGGSPLGDETLIQLSGIISSIAAVSGIDSKRAITRAAVKTAPEFKQISKAFFQAAKETPVIAKASHSKDYDEIAEFVLANPELSPKERLKLYGELYENRTAKIFEFLKKFSIVVILLSILACIGIYFLNPDAHEAVNAFFDKCRKKLSKLWKHVQRITKIIKQLSGLILK